MEVYYTTAKGRRESNEDGHNIILNLSNEDPDFCKINLFGIYDGHGGNKVAKFLERNIPIIYMNKNNKIPFSDNFHIKKFQELQKKILESEYGFISGSACILAIIYLKNEKKYLNVINLGDCRAVIVNHDKSVSVITTDHKPDIPEEEKRINDLGGKVIIDEFGIARIGELSLSRCFGDGDTFPYVSQTPDIFNIKLKKSMKYIVIACDGLWDVVRNEELFDLIEKSNENKSVNLVSTALERESMDNVSCIIIELLNI